MKKIIVENIVDSMILATDVSGPSGSVLLSSGATLSPALGRRLKNWGIHFVNVQSDEEVDASENVANISKEEITRTLARRFSAVMGNDLMKKIFDAVLCYKIQKGAL